MKKNYTDSDIKKLLVDLAEFIPEIDPNDSEWGAFLREFIAARPDVQLDEAFAKEVRHRILERAKTLKTKKQFLFPQWLKFGGTFVAGAAVCALLVIPLLQSPDEIQENTLEDMAPMRMMARGGGMTEEAVPLILHDADEIQEFALAPMMAKGIVEPIQLESLPEVDMNREMAAAGTLNPMRGKPRLMMAEDTISGSSTMEIKLSWEDMPSDAEILRVATEFFRNHKFDSLGSFESRVDKWWENEDKMNWQPEFAPDRVGVVFAFDGGEVRIDVDMRTLEVVWMSLNKQ